MIRYPEQFRSKFRQTGNSCAMAAYSVIANYFLTTAYFDPFEAYCEHFGMRLRDHAAEGEFCVHASAYKDDLPWSLRILALHSVSMDPFFVRARQSFTGEFFPDADAIPERLVRRLQDDDALLHAGLFPTHGGMVHVIALGKTPAGFVLKDANEDRVLQTGFQSINDVLRHYEGRYRWTDGVVYKAVKRN